MADGEVAREGEDINAEHTNTHNVKRAHTHTNTCHTRASQGEGERREGGQGEVERGGQGE